MAQTIVKIEGSIVNCLVWTPREGMKGKPCLKVDVLQLTSAGSNIQTIKDDELNAVYTVGDFVTLECTASPYSFDKKSGVSFKVFRGETKNITLSVPSDALDCDMPPAKKSLAAKYK